MEKNNARVLMLSHRNIANRIFARCVWFEFEDMIKQIDCIAMLAPERVRSVKGFDTGYRIASKVGQYLPIALNPGVPSTTVEKEYDLFFTVCTFPMDLLYVNALKNWRKKCETAVCWIDEMYVTDIQYAKYSKEIISQFDHVIVSCNRVAREIKKLIQGECLFLIPGIDSILFCPHPKEPDRFIDILSIGRRSEDLHNYLVKALEKNELFYVYDTVSSHGCKYGLTTADPKQHRLLYANMVKRSKYFLVDTGKFDDIKGTDNEEIIGARYVEGAAAGTIMIGKQPSHPEFSKLFFWYEPVIDISANPDRIVEIIKEIDNQIDRKIRIRKDNIVNSLRYHDWVYRWELILKLAKLDPLPALVERKSRLKELADIVDYDRALNCE